MIHLVAMRERYNTLRLTGKVIYRRGPAAAARRPHGPICGSLADNRCRTKRAEKTNRRSEPWFMESLCAEGTRIGGEDPENFQAPHGCSGRRYSDRAEDRRNSLARRNGLCAIVSVARMSGGTSASAIHTRRSHSDAHSPAS